MNSLRELPHRSMPSHWAAWRHRYHGWRVPARYALALVLGLATEAALVVAQQPGGYSAEARGHAQRGVRAQQENRLEDAVREFEALIRLTPALPPAHVNLGLARHAQKDWKAAAASFEKALALQSDLKGVRGFLGYDLLLLGRADEAVKTLRKALGEDPESTDVTTWLGLAEAESGDWASAISHFETALRSKPSDADLLFHLAEAHANRSAELHDRLFELAPDSYRAHLARAQTLDVSGRVQEAVEAYRKVLERNPAIKGVHGAIGDLYAKTANYDEARRSYAEELKRNPESPVILYRYGASLLKLGKSAEALGQFRRSLELDPSLDQLYFEMGKALIDEGQFHEGARILVKALTGNAPPDARMTAHYQLSQIYKRLGEPEKAASHLATFSKLKNETAARQQ